MRLEASKGDSPEVWLTDTDIEQLQPAAASYRDDIIIQLGAYVGLRAFEIPQIRPRPVKETETGTRHLHELAARNHGATPIRYQRLVGLFDVDRRTLRTGTCYVYLTATLGVVECDTSASRAQSPHRTGTAAVQLVRETASACSNPIQILAPLGCSCIEPPTYASVFLLRSFRRVLRQGVTPESAHQPGTSNECNIYESSGKSFVHYYGFLDSSGFRC